MTVAPRSKFSAAKNLGGLRVIARLDRSDYERHSRSLVVQKLIQSARRTWKKHNGTDPAVARLRDPD